MVSAELFDMLSFIGSRIRGNNLPFGGIQLVVCGDFFQLPPVGLGKNTKFCFESQIWNEIFSDQFGSNILLSRIFRQQGDEVFLQILNEIRLGKISQNSTSKILERALDGNDEINENESQKVKPTKLFSTNRDVDDFNLTQLKELNSNDRREKSVHFKSIDEGIEPYLSQLRAGTKAPQELTLVVGAQVFFLLLFCLLFIFCLL